MRPRKLTGLAAKAVEFRDKVSASTDHLAEIKKQLQQGGEDYSDAVDQVEKIERAFDGLSDLFIDLSVLILKADKVKAAADQEPPQEHHRENTAGGHQPSSR